MISTRMGELEQRENGGWYFTLTADEETAACVARLSKIEMWWWPEEEEDTYTYRIAGRYNPQKAYAFIKAAVEFLSEGTA